MEKRFAKGMWITFKSEDIWTIREDCSNNNSKEKELQLFALRVDQLIDCQQKEKKRSYRCLLSLLLFGFCLEE